MVVRGNSYHTKYAMRKTDGSASSTRFSTTLTILPQHLSKVFDFCIFILLLLACTQQQLYQWMNYAQFVLWLWLGFCKASSVAMEVGLSVMSLTRMYINFISQWLIIRFLLSHLWRNIVTSRKIGLNEHVIICTSPWIFTLSEFLCWWFICMTYMYM